MLALLTVVGCVSPGEDGPSPASWNRFRGPNGTGIAAGRGYPSEIGPDSGVLWKREFPEGFSSPVLSRDSYNFV